VAASNQIVPSGGKNHVGYEYLSPQGAATVVRILDQSVGGTEWARIDCGNQVFKVDTVGEFTSAAGVTIDGVLLKDNYTRLPNNTYYRARNAANSADINLAKINASNRIEFGTTVEALALQTALPIASGGTGATSASAARTALGLVIGTNVAAAGANSDITALTGIANSTWSPTITGSGSMTISAQSTKEANYFRVGPRVFFEFVASFTLGGTANTLVQIPRPVAGVTHDSLCSFACTAVDGGGTIINNGLWRLVGSNIIVFKPGAANWTLGANAAVHIQGSYLAS